MKPNRVVREVRYRIPDNRAVQTLLHVLTPRQEQLIRMRYGIDEPACSLEDIAQRFAVTKERIRQLLIGAIGRLAWTHGFDEELIRAICAAEQAPAVPGAQLPE